MSVLPTCGAQTDERCVRRRAQYYDKSTELHGVHYLYSLQTVATEQYDGGLSLSSDESRARLDGAAGRRARG